MRCGRGGFVVAGRAAGLGGVAGLVVRSAGVAQDAVDLVRQVPGKSLKAQAGELRAGTRTFSFT